MKNITFIALLILGALTLMHCGGDDAPQPDDQNGSVTITASDFTATIDENPDAMAAIGTVTASASDNSTLTYSISTQSVAGALAIDASTGALTVADASAFDYETNTSITGTYKATSGDVEEEGDINITINDVDEAFILTFRTTTANESVTIGTFSDFTYNFNVDWGDGTPLDNNQTGDVSHVFASSGDHQISITGDYPAFDRGNIENARKLISVDQWGSQVWLTMQSAFQQCSNLVSVGSDAPDLSQVKNMTGMFAAATNFNSPIGHWDVSNVTSMISMFTNASSFNGDISTWDVTSVSNMNGMFFGASAFDQPLNDWDVSNVTNMGSMFRGASAFDRPLNKWDVSSVTNMSIMFTGVSAFNQPLNDWDVSNVTDMGSMFTDASAFNQPLSNWDVSNVTNMGFMFLNATQFNQNISQWKTNNVNACTNFSKDSALEIRNTPFFLNCNANPR